MVCAAWTWYPFVAANPQKTKGRNENETYLCIFDLGGAGVQPAGRPLLCRRAGGPARAAARRDRPGTAGFGYPLSGSASGCTAAW